MLHKSLGHPRHCCHWCCVVWTTILRAVAYICLSSYCNVGVCPAFFVVAFGSVVLLLSSSLLPWYYHCYSSCRVPVAPGTAVVLLPSVLHCDIVGVGPVLILWLSIFRWYCGCRSSGDAVTVLILLWYCCCGCSGNGTVAIGPPVMVLW